ncbi:MAG: HDOD domain-containing protein [Myxococcota bacterium]
MEGSITHSNAKPTSDAAPVALLAEPISPIRWHLGRSLSLVGFEVFGAGTLSDVFHTLASVGIPDVLVMNADLAGTSSYELARGLRSMRTTGSVPAIIVDRNVSDEPMSHDGVHVIVGPSSLGGLTDSILHLASTATSGAAPCDLAALKQLVASNTADLEYDLDRAFRLYNLVLKRLKSGDLPGPVSNPLMEQARTLINDPRTTFHDLAECVRTHPVAAAKLLAIANSPAYRGAYPTTSVETAVGRLGLHEASRLLQAIALRGYVVGSDKSLREAILIRLRHNLVAAIVAQALAPLNEADPEASYAVALFHDLGATLMLYTVGLMHDEGEMPTVDLAGLEAAMRTRHHQLETLAMDTLGLSDLLLGQAGNLENQVVAQSLHAADAMDQGQDADAFTFYGLHEEHIEVMKAAMPKARYAAMAIFGSALTHPSSDAPKKSK